MHVIANKAKQAVGYEPGRKCTREPKNILPNLT